MTSNWLTAWAAAGWSAAFVLAAGVHLRHTATMTGRRRAWHLTHVLMALGMIDMFWPIHPMPVGARVGEVVFTVAAIGVAGLIAIAAVRHQPDSFLWEITFLDLIAMIYMFFWPAHDSVVIITTLSAWFVLEAVGWATGLLGWAAQSAGLGLTPRIGSNDPRPPGLTVSGATAMVTEMDRTEDPLHGREVRFTLTVMSAGMAHMLLALHFGLGAQLTGR
jgi:hypothetical protein